MENYNAIQIITEFNGELLESIVSDIKDENIKGNIVKFRFLDTTSDEIKTSNWVYFGTRITEEDAKCASNDSKYYEKLYYFMLENDITSFCDNGSDLYKMEDDAVTLSEYKFIEKKKVRERK